MHSRDIVRVIISPCSSHAFGVDMIWHDVVVVRESVLADTAPSVLRYDLAIEQLPHLSIGTELTKATRMMRIVDLLNAHLPDAPHLVNHRSAAAVQRSANRAWLRRSFIESLLDRVEESKRTPIPRPGLGSLPHVEQWRKCCDT